MSTDIQSYDADGIYQVFGHPRAASIVPCSEEQTSPGPHAPRCAIEPIDFCAADVGILARQIRILDFDQSFSCDNPPRQLGTPARYMAPEVIAGAPPSRASDVWSLGCTIFRLRSGFDIFVDHDTRYPADALQQIQRYLGDLPDGLARARFDEDGYATGDESGTPLTYFMSGRSLGWRIARIWDDPPSRTMRSSGEVDTVEYAPPSPRYVAAYPDDAKMMVPYPAVYEEILWKPTAVRVDGQFFLAYPDGEESPQSGTRAYPRIGSEEARLLGDLLSRIFVYDPLKRITVQEVLEHPWILRFGRTAGEDA